MNEMTRRDVLALAGAALLGGRPRQGAAGEELRLWRDLWAADWRRGFSLEFVGRNGERRKLFWHRNATSHGGFLMTDERSADADDFWPVFTEFVYAGDGTWLDAMVELGYRYFRADWWTDAEPATLTPD